MKNLLEIIKITLLISIVVILTTQFNLLGSQAVNFNATEVQIKQEEVKKQGNHQNKSIDNIFERKKDIRTIMENSLRKIFKIPGGVKFKNVKFEHKKLYANSGIMLKDLSKEIELSQMCGYYSAQNGLGVNSLYQPFYIKLAINNDKKGLTGSVYYKNDSKYKKLLSMESDLSLDSDKKEFEALWKNLCGELDEQYLGVFSGYKFGYDALGYEEIDKFLQSLASHKPSLEYFNKCQIEGEKLQICLIFSQCKATKVPDKLTELCEEFEKNCKNIDSAKSCSKIIDKVFKEKKGK